MYIYVYAFGWWDTYRNWLVCLFVFIACLPGVELFLLLKSWQQHEGSHIILSWLLCFESNWAMKPGEAFRVEVGTRREREEWGSFKKNVVWKISERSRGAVCSRTMVEKQKLFQGLREENMRLSNSVFLSCWARVWNLRKETALKDCRT